MPSWGTIIAAIVKAVLSSIFGAARTRRQDDERNAAIVGHALEKQAAEHLQRRIEIQERMANAQANAPSTRAELIERLRRESVQEADPGVSPAPAEPSVPEVESGGKGSQEPTG